MKNASLLHGRMLLWFVIMFAVVTGISMESDCKVLAETYGDYEYEVLDDGTVAITKYNGDASEVSIATKIDGKKVTIIRGGAFAYNTDIKSVKIPEGVTKIIQIWHDEGVTGAFEGCTSLSSISLPDSLIETH